MSKNDTSVMYAESTNWRTARIYLIILLSGMALHIGAFSINNESLRSVMRDIGSVCVSSSIFGWIWDLKARRSFTKEVMAIAKLREDIQSSGILEYKKNFREDIDWNSLIGESNKLIVCVSYGRTWRRTYDYQLKAFAKKSNITVDIILPDPNNKSMMTDLSIRYGTDVNIIKSRINEAISDFTKVFENVSKFNIWLLKINPVYSFYLFDNKAVIAFYKHRISMEEVPAFIVAKGGHLYEFVTKEAEECLNGTITSKYEE